MEGIEFDLNNDQGARDLSRKNAPAKARPSILVGLLAKVGIGDPMVANFVLAGVASVFFGIAIFLYAGVVEEDASAKLSYTEVTAQLKVLEEMQKPHNK